MNLVPPRLTMGRLATPARRYAFARPLVLATAAVLVASGARWIEVATGVHTHLGLGPDATRTFLAAIAGTMVTATVVVFWVRGLLVSAHAGRFPNRILTDYLADRYQQWMMGSMVGVFSFSATGMVAVSLGGEGDPPDLAGGLLVVIAGLSAVGALLVIVQSIDSGVRAMHEERILRQVMQSAFAMIELDYPERSEAPQLDHLPTPDRGATVVRSTEIGWVRAIDEEALLESLPQDTTCWLEARIGHFVSPATALCRLDGPGAYTVERKAVERAFTIGDTRDPDRDLALALRNLVDVALGALVDGADQTTARGAIAHLGAVMRPVVAWDGPASVRDGDDGQRLVRSRDPDYVHYVDEAFSDLGRVADPQTARYVLSVLGDLVEVAEEVGRPERAETLRRQTESILDQVRHNGATDADVAVLRERVTRPLGPDREDSEDRETAAAGPG